MAKDMTKGSLVGNLVSFSVPLILSGILQQLYSWADAFIVGNVEGEAALAAIGATNAITNFFIIAITGFTAGVSILSAQYFGKGNHSIQKKILSSFIIVLGTVFLIISVIGIFCANGFLKLLDTPEDILGMARSYLQIVLVGMPFLNIYNIYSAVLRGIGDSKAPFYSVMVSAVTNVVLDIIFVGGLHWKVEGAAIATVIAQIMMTVFIIAYAKRRYMILRFEKTTELYDKKIVKDGCKLAIPIAIQSLVNSAGSLMLQNFMNGFGSKTVAAITSAYRVDSVILLPIINLGTGITTITSQNTGAGEHKRARKGLFVGTALMAVVSLGLAGIVVIAGGSLIELFGLTKESVEIGSMFFRLIAPYYIVYGTAMAIRGYLEGTGDVVFSGIIGISSLIVRIAMSYILKPYYGNKVIAYAEAIAWTFMLVVYIIRFGMKYRKKEEMRQIYTE